MQADQGAGALGRVLGMEEGCPGHGDEDDAEGRGDQGLDQGHAAGPPDHGGPPVLRMTRSTTLARGWAAEATVLTQ